MNMTIADFTYDTTRYACGENKQTAISELQSLAFRLLKWFENKQMKANPGKSHILLSNNKTEKVTIKYTDCTKLKCRREITLNYSRSWP